MSLDVALCCCLFLCAVVRGVWCLCLVFVIAAVQNKQGLRRVVILKKGTQHFNRSRAVDVDPVYSGQAESSKFRLPTAHHKI